MSEMVEKVARALCASAKDDPEKWWPQADGLRDKRGWQLYEEDARAAITAMREPTRRMLDASRERFEIGIVPGWNAAIDAALSDIQ